MKQQKRMNCEIRSGKLIGSAGQTIIELGTYCKLFNLIDHVIFETTERGGDQSDKSQETDLGSPKKKTMISVLFTIQKKTN